MTKKREKPFHLDMSFDEALKRFVQTDPRELPNPKKAKKKKRASKRRGPAALPMPPPD
jgi:hypothetical protein